MIKQTAKIYKESVDREYKFGYESGKHHKEHAEKYPVLAADNVIKAGKYKELNPYWLGYYMALKDQGIIAS